MGNIAALPPTSVDVVLSQARAKSSGIAKVDDATVKALVDALAQDGDSKSDLDQLFRLRKEGVFTNGKEALDSAIRGVTERVWDGMVKTIEADGVITPAEQAEVKALLTDPRFALKQGLNDLRSFSDYAASFNAKQAIKRVPDQCKALDDKRVALQALKLDGNVLLFIENANATIGEGNRQLQALSSDLEALRRTEKMLPRSAQAGFRAEMAAAEKKIDDAAAAYREARQKLVEQMETLKVAG